MEGFVNPPNRGDRIRTCDISLPKRVLYQTELHPVVYLMNYTPIRWFCQGISTEILETALTAGIVAPLLSTPSVRGNIFDHGQIVLDHDRVCRHSQ
jgi:hypothetical protein